MSGDDFSVVEEECARHLEAISGEASDAAAFEDRDCAKPPNPWAEEFEDAALAESETAVEFTAGVGDPGHFIVLVQIAGFLAVSEHVHEHEFGAVIFGLLVE